MRLEEVTRLTIWQTSPNRKLPALFLLDSIVKNVGTPYTVYLGRNLYSTFMDAYTLVDGGTRRHMEGMLKTWKEPVPGSIDPRPVFPLDTVRPIDDALNKAKAVFQQRQNLPQVPYRAMATPPQHNGQYTTPPPQAFPPQWQRYGSQQVGFKQMSRWLIGDCELIVFAAFSAAATVRISASQFESNQRGRGREARHRCSNSKIPVPALFESGRWRSTEAAGRTARATHLA